MLRGIRKRLVGQGRRCTLAYAASVSWMVLSYSFREEILRARLSLMRASRSVRIRKSFWILAASGCERHGGGCQERC